MHSPPRPQEEFYALDQDPHELNNLMGDPAYTRSSQNIRSINFLKTGPMTLFRPFTRLTNLSEKPAVTPARIRPRPSKAEMRATRHP